MESILHKLNIYMIPPFLSLVMGLTLAGITVIKGKLKTENMLFALVCVWWVLLSPAFILHHLLRGQETLILTIERVIHFFYVYIPAIYFIYFSRMLGFRSRPVEIALFSLSFLISLTVPTEYYFYGLYSYDWGYIAKGGVAFQVFGVYSFIVIMFFIYRFIKKIRVEKNRIIILKLKYIAFSFMLSSVFTLLNIPAINGIDLYPIGNFSFIPLSFMAYGVLRYRLMDIRSILHITLVWAATSSLIIVPNALIFYFLYPYLPGIPPAGYFIILMSWFIANFLYIKTVQPLIDQLFNRRKYNLDRIEEKFIEYVTTLKTLEDLARQFTDIIKKSLSFKTAQFIICSGRQEEKAIGLDEGLKQWFARYNQLIDRDLVASDDQFIEIRDGVLKLCERYGSDFILPLAHNNELIALLLLPERQNLQQLTTSEIHFLHGIKSAAAIALANSIMYNDISRMKEILEINVNQLSGLLPICANCKKIRDDQGYWQQVEKYIGDHTDVKFSHSLCPDCVRKLYPDMADQMLK